ncbi:MAG: hypothetical protein LBM08_00700 [Dysgonamonadaceae bacterium]|jgi:hypothetical protein|nr:hypothetical protein [Dysgonamonadaceae bacterium]
MNRERRDELRDAAYLLDDAIDALETVKSDEQDAFDSMPEGFQNSARGDRMMAAIDAIDILIDKIDSIKSDIEQTASTI